MSKEYLDSEIINKLESVIQDVYVIEDELDIERVINEIQSVINDLKGADE